MRLPFFGKTERVSRYSVEPSFDNVAAPQVNNAGTSMFTSSNFVDFVTMGLQTAGVMVTEQTALQISAVYACVALIGGSIASMPINIYQRIDNVTKLATHDLWWLLNEQPYPEYSAATFWEAMLGSLLLHGDAFALINRPNFLSDKIDSFEWLHPRRVTVKRVDGQLMYVVQNDLYSDNKDKNAKAYLSQDIIHIPGPGFNGLRGMSQIKYVLRNSAGIALAADQYSAGFFQNGARPDFAIVHPGNPTPEQVQTLRETWMERHQGVSKAGLPAVLAGGMSVQELTMNAEDSQLIMTRQFQIEEIARIFGCPPHMIGHTDGNTSWGTGVEQMSMGFVKYTLSRFMTKIEQEINRKVWPIRDRYFIKFDTSGLERGDTATRTNGYRAALGRAGEQAYMTVNEVRTQENLPPIDGGNKLNNEVNPNAPAPDPAVSA